MTHPADQDDVSESKMTTRTRVALFVVVCMLAAGAAVGALAVAKKDRERTIAATGIEISRPAEFALDDGPVILFESTAFGDSYGLVSSVPVATPDAPRAVSDLRCERVDLRAGRGVCLQSDRGMLTTYDALVFDEQMNVTHTVGLPGTPSRVRISPDGSIAGMTVFVTGHSYADGNFSTQTTLLDLETGEPIADLEVDFEVLRDGETWQAIDFNFWGVTFVDENTFYATLGTGGEAYLVKGDIEARQMTVVRDEVECPSLSPDGTRIAYKLRSETGGIGPLTWNIAVLDLATSEVTVLAETRNVDDQVAWLDDDTVMYGLADPDSPAEPDTWIVPADGTGEPRLFISQAWSGVVVP